MTGKQTVNWGHPLCVALLVGLGAWPAAAQGPGGDPYAGLAATSFKYGDKDVRDTVLALCAIPPAARDEAARFRLSYYLREWTTIRDTLRRMPAETATRIYGKIVYDLSRERAPMLAEDDFFGLLDACPSAPDDTLLRNLGDVARTVIRPEERGRLGTRLELGTAFFGGTNFTQRLNLGRVMLQARIDDLAGQFLPPQADLGRIANEAVRREALQFYKVQDDLRATPAREKSIDEIEHDFTAIAAACFADPESRRKAEADLLPALGQRLPHRAVLDPAKAHLADAGQDKAAAYVARLTEVFEAYRAKNAAPVVRLNHLVLQAELAGAIGDKADLKTAPWNPIMVSMANHWMAEVEDMARKKEALEASGRPDNFVAPGDLLATAPAGAWLGCLPEGMRERIRILQVRAFMFADRWNEAFATIVTLGQGNRTAAAQLTADCLARWARVHDPTIPDDVKKAFALSQSQIVVTPLVAARNLAYYADLMALMRTNQVPMKDMGYLLDINEHSQGTGTAYRREDLEKVFGPVVDLDPDAFLTLATRMRTGLGDRWRKAGASDGAEVLAMVRNGYATALKMIDDWSARQPADWKALREGAVMASDWADFEYFQVLAKPARQEAQALYDARNKLSEAYFHRAAKPYLAVAARSAKWVETEEPLFVTWFRHLMGLNSNGEINLSKTPSALALAAMRDLITSLPPDAAKAQMAALSGFVDATLNDPKGFDPNLKFKFMQSSLLITMGTSFADATSNKVAYLETLLDGVRLDVSVDGPNTLWRKEDAGLIVALRHTALMGRQINFGTLVADMPAPRPTDKARKMLSADNARNELESNILKALSPYFDIRSITLSPVTVKPVPAEEPGWERTVLAYVVIHAFDVSVDRIPQLTLTLNFLDKTGPVALPVKSPEVMIRLSEQPTPPRHVDDLRLTQALDARQLETTGDLTLGVTATGSGLVPPLTDLVDLKPLEASAAVTRIVAVDGPTVREFQTSNRTVSVTSERRWKLEIDGRKIARASARQPVYFPVPRDAGVAVRNSYYADADLVDTTNAFALVGKGGAPDTGAGKGGPGRTADASGRVLGGAALALAVLLGVVLAVLRLRRTSTQRPVQARDVFRLPARLDAFRVVSLLRNLLASDLVHLSDEQRQTLTSEMHRIESACFGTQGTGMTEDELRRVATTALKMCCG